MSEDFAPYGKVQIGPFRLHREINEIRMYPSNELKYHLSITITTGDFVYEKINFFADTEPDARKLFRIECERFTNEHNEACQEMVSKRGSKAKLKRFKEVKHGSSR